jgi:hypothetical protein
VEVLEGTLRERYDNEPFHVWGCQAEKRRLFAKKAGLDGSKERQARKGPVAALNAREQQLGSESRRRLRFAGCHLEETAKILKFIPEPTI